MQSGELVDWNDDRGFGFIQGADGQRYFVHISAIGRINTRPRHGDRVSFTPHRDAAGRPQARSVAISGANPRHNRDVDRHGLPERPAQTMIGDWRLLASLLLLGLLATGFLLGRLPPSVPIFYAIMSVASLANYRLDKHFARRREWRTSEAVLLSLDLACGIIGGLLGQAWFRHKTMKRSYAFMTLILVLVHALWLAGLASGRISIAGPLTLFGG